MKHLLLLLLSFISALQGFAYDLDDFIIACKEMPNASYSSLEGDKLHEMLNSLSTLPPMHIPAGEAIAPDSLFRDVKKIDCVIFMNMNVLNGMQNPAAGEDGGSDVFAEIKAAANKIEGYDEYVYGSMIPASMTPAMAEVDRKEYDDLTSQLSNEQKDEFKALMNNSFRLAIFGERTPELEFKNPIIIISFMGFTDVIMAMEGIVPIVNIDSWVKSIQF